MPRKDASVTQSPQQSERSGGSATLMTVALALALLLVGALGYEAATLLQYALSTPPIVNGSAASTAAFVCASLEHQDYQRLVTYIDPATIPPAITRSFDARQTITAMQARDTTEGKVVACGYAAYSAGGIVSTDSAIRYQLTLRRAAAAAPSVGTLILRQRSSGAHGWLIGRDSSFLAPPAA